jgi:hypothetical protein
VQKSTAILLLSAMFAVPLPGQDPLDLPSPRARAEASRNKGRNEDRNKGQSRPAPVGSQEGTGSSITEAKERAKANKEGKKAAESDPPARTRMQASGQGMPEPSPTPGSLGAPMGGPLVEDKGPTQSRTMSEDIRERLQADEYQKSSESGTRMRRSKGPMQEDLDQAGPREDLLDRVLERLGGMKAYRSMDAIAVQRNLKANDVKGKLLFAHRFWHWARISGTVLADEIQWSESFRYGRRGGRVWARSSDVDRPDLEDGIRNEVMTWGFLLRFPFILRDRDRYSVLPEEKVLLLGQTFLRMRILDRSGEIGKHAADPLDAPSGASDGASDGRTGKAVSSHKGGAKKDWVDLYLDPKELLPLFVEFHRRGKTRRIHLDQYKPVTKGGPLFPHRRTVLGEDGETPSLEITWEISKQRKWR